MQEFLAPRPTLGPHAGLLWMSCKGYNRQSMYAVCHVAQLKRLIFEFSLLTFVTAMTCIPELKKQGNTVEWIVLRMTNVGTDYNRYHQAEKQVNSMSELPKQSANITSK